MAKSKAVKKRSSTSKKRCPSGSRRNSSGRCVKYNKKKSTGSKKSKGKKKSSGKKKTTGKKRSSVKTVLDKYGRKIRVSKDRKGPAAAAENYSVGTQRRGQDGNMWRITRTKKSKKWSKMKKE
jgi:hypothetical protein